MRQKLSDPGDGMGSDAGKDVLEPGEGFDTNPLARRRKTPEHRSRFAALVAAEEGPVVAADRQHASILPISGRKLRFTIVGIRFMVDDCGCSAANNVRAGRLSMSKWHPAL